MHTKKIYRRNNKSKTIKKKYGGNPDDIPCGVSESGEKLKCPSSYRCETVNNKKLCKPSIIIKLNYKNESTTLSVPWKRHEKWMKYQNILNLNIQNIKTMQSSTKLSKEVLLHENKSLFNMIDDNQVIKDFQGANNLDELIIQNIILHHYLESIGKLDEKQTKEEAIETEPEDQIEEKNQVLEVEDQTKKEDPSEPEEEKEQLDDKELKNIQEKLEPLPSKEDEQKYNKYLHNYEKTQNEYLKTDNTLDFLYPELDDPNFNKKIAEKKEFNETQYDGKIYNVKEQAEKMCKTEFELMPYQLFVKNFLSIQTPYNSLLLYHGVGTGKTCSAIGIAEEMREFNQNIGSIHKIFVIASPNVQSNFKTQLFDERKLKLEGGVWNMNTCVGNKLLKEINPLQMKDLEKANVVVHINSIIKQYYKFMGYSEFANYVKRKTMVPDNLGLNIKDQKKLEIENIKKLFNNRLIIIDEVHNISAIQSNKENKKTSALLMHVCKHSENMRLLLLSATPMYNSYKEIIWLTNLLNIVDKRAQIKEEDVFDKDGNFIEEKTLEDGTVIEGGKELLTRKLTGYVSYVRGENPYTFPYRIYPDIFDKDHLINYEEYPSYQMNKKKIETPMKYMPIYMNNIGGYQEKVYNFVINNIRMTSYASNLQNKDKNMPDFENMESFGYTLLSSPIQSLNIAYPNEEFDALNIQESQDSKEDSVQLDEKEEIELENNTNIINNMLGSKGLSNIMDYKTTTSPYLLRSNFTYKEDVISKYGRIFSETEIGKYSAKIKKICQSIKQSKGIVMIYSQYIDNGVVPIALALEEMGFARYGTTSYTKSLFETQPKESLDSNTMKLKNELSDDELKNYKQAKYVMITGDKYFSPNNEADLKQLNNNENKTGGNIKVVLITKAAAEGMDFKNIRQLHVLEPWYNSSRTEQIIGRAVRNLSHCNLPFEERNVEIYLHGTTLSNNEEATDLYIYRYAENKATKIGKITRLLKENAVDCILNIGQTNMTLEKFIENSQEQEFDISLSSSEDKTTIKYKIGDKPYTDICDYMDSCNYVCNNIDNVDEKNLIKSTYNEQYVKMNYPMLVKRIRQLFKEESFYDKDTLVNLINMNKVYPLDHINYTLTQFVDNKSEYILDKYGRYGYMINKDNYYAFQPYEISDEYASLHERSIPIEQKIYKLNMELKDRTDELNVRDETKKDTDTPSTLIQKIFSNLKQSIDDLNNEKELYRKLEGELGSLDTINKRKLALMREKYKKNSDDNSWYVNLGRIYDTLNKDYFISESQLLEYSIHHFIDTLKLNEHKTLVEYIYSEEVNDNSTYKNYITTYYDKNIMISNNVKAIILPDVRKSVLFLFKDKSSLVEGKPTDYLQFKTEIQTNFAIPNENINEIIGFMYNFKNNKIFKIKNVVKDRNNTGSLCENLGRVDILHRIEPLIQSNPYKFKEWPKYVVSNFDKMLKTGLCVFVECILRFYNDSDNEKYWYLNSTLALSNSIIQR